MDLAGLLFDPDCMIRVAVVDDHPAVRLGLLTALRSEPGLVPVGTASGPAEVKSLIHRTRPGVVLLDYYLDGEDGLELCLEIAAGTRSPAIVIYSAYAGASMVIPAIVAGAGGIVHKGAPAHALFEAIRRVSGGGSTFPAVDADLLNSAATALDPDDLPILGMLVNSTGTGDIMATLGIDDDEFNRRIRRMLGALRPAAAGARR